jgi:hypothetical protein
MWSEKLKFRDVVGFMWASRWELLSFVVWTGRVQREARKKP